MQTTKPAPEKVEEPVEAKVGDIVKLFMGRGQVRAVREDGMLEVWSMGWEVAGEQRPRYYVRKDAVKVLPTGYSSMSGKKIRRIFFHAVVRVFFRSRCFSRLS